MIRVAIGNSYVAISPHDWWDRCVSTFRHVAHALTDALPDWLNASFFAAAAVGFVIQLAFSVAASRESRALYRRTTHTLVEITTAQERMERVLVEMSAVALSAERSITDAATTSLGASAADLLSDVNPEMEPEVPMPLSEVPNALLEQLRQAGGAASIDEVFGPLRGQVKLQHFMQALYGLRTAGHITWDDAVLSWTSRVHLRV